MPKFPWGKYKGDHIEDIPSSYLVWLLDNGKMRDPLLARECASEIIRRMQEYAPASGNGRRGYVGDPEAGTFNPPRDDGPRPTPIINPSPAAGSLRAELALRVIDKGYRVVARDVHPDTGGTPEAFRELTSVTDALRKKARQV